jgi:hypothetical protein
VSPKTLISGELGAFLESGLSIVAATRDGELQPDGAVIWAARVHEDRAHLTVFLHDKAARQLLRNLKKHPAIALDFDLPTSHRACQVKGVYVSSRRARSAEQAVVDTQIDRFGADLEAIGIPRAMMTGWTTWPCTAMEIRVTEIYEQTPGPGTGEPIR